MAGADLEKWLDNDRNLALLPPLLQQQVLLGREVQEGFSVDTEGQMIALIDRVLGRDAGWLDYYQREVKLAQLDRDQLERHNVAEPFMVKAALSEATYAAAMWHGDPTTARRELEKTVDTTAQYDTPLGGWRALWLGAAYELEGDKNAARASFGHAMRRFDNGITLPRPVVDATDQEPPSLNAFGRSLQGLLYHGHGNKFEAELVKLKRTFAQITGGSSNQAEAGVRALGELLGFELKTDKLEPATYFKKDISQSHDHLVWMEQNYPNHEILGFVFVGPSGEVHAKANPSKCMSLCLPSALSTLSNELLALIEDLRNQTPIERLIGISNESDDPRWNIHSVFARLNPTKLFADM